MGETIIFIGIPIVILVWVLVLAIVKRKVRSHRTAILATAIPPSLLLIATIVYFYLNFEAIVKAEGTTVVDICFWVASGLVVAALLSSFVFVIRRKWEIAKGTGFGSGIGLIMCFIAFVACSW